MTDTKTVQELLEPVDRDYKAWRMFVEAEEKHEQDDMNKMIDDFIEDGNMDEYDIMVEDVVYYILDKIGENGVPENIADKIRRYSIELIRDTLWPLPVAGRIAEQAIARYKDGLYSTNWKETI